MNTEKRGGKREGAGRKKAAEKRQTITVTLPPKLIEKLGGNRSKLIESALIAYLSPANSKAS